MLHDEAAKHAIDAASVAVTVATIMDLLPGIAALFTVIWTALRIYDWIEERIERRRRKTP